MARLGDVCEVLNGFAFKSENYVNEGIRIIRIANVQKGTIEDNSPVFYPFEDVDAQKYRLSENDLLISLTGNVGRVALITKSFLPAALNQRVACLRIKNGVNLDKSYLYNFLNSDFFEQKCIASSKGVAQKNMSTEWLKNYDIPIPNIDEQKKIAFVLDEISSLIAEHNKQLLKLNEFVKSRFVELFGDPKLNEKGWEMATVADYYHVKGGKRIPKGMGYADGVTKHPYLRATDMKNGTIVDTDIHYIDDEVFSHIKRYIVAAGDIYLTNVGVNLGMAGVIPPKFDGASLTENAVKLVPYKDGIDGKFLSYYINSPGVQEYIAERKMTVGVPKLAIFRIETMPLIIPPIETQRRFVIFVEQTDKLNSEIKQSIEKLETLKKALMQKYFG